MKAPQMDNIFQIWESLLNIGSWLGNSILSLTEILLSAYYVTDTRLVTGNTERKSTDTVIHLVVLWSGQVNQHEMNNCTHCSCMKYCQEVQGAMRACSELA